VYILIHKDTVIGRGALAVMASMREQMASFTGRDIREYTIHKS
jgi:hypothetical protein